MARPSQASNGKKVWARELGVFISRSSTCNTPSLSRLEVFPSSLIRPLPRGELKAVFAWEEGWFGWRKLAVSHGYIGPSLTDS